MDWATRRKTTIIGVFTIIVVVIISIFVYNNFLKNEATCFDKKQNQNERGIDCGGVCSLMCVADIKPILPLWVRPIKIVGDVYSVVAYIENQNQGSGVESVSYEIRLYDDKNLLATNPIVGTTFLEPNDRTAIFETGIKVNERIPKTAFITFSQPLVFTKVSEKYDRQNLIVENDLFEDLNTTPKLSANIRNTTFSTFYNIPVVVIIYDINGNAIATSQTIIDQIGSEETVPIYFTWPEPLSGVPVRREIIPRINPFIQPS